MVITRCVTSDVHIRSGALIPLLLGGLGWPDFWQGNNQINGHIRCI